MSDPQSHVLSLFLIFSCAAKPFRSTRRKLGWLQGTDDQDWFGDHYWGRDLFGNFISLTNHGRPINGVYPSLVKLWFLVPLPCRAPVVNLEHVPLAAFHCYFHCFIFQWVRIPYLMTFQFITCSIFCHGDLRLLSKNKRVENLLRIPEYLWNLELS